MRDDQGLSPMMAALAESLRASDLRNCIDVDRLTDWADGSLPEAQRADVLDHIAVCPSCATVAAELAETYAPVKALHDGWLGMRGPLLRATGALRRDRVLSHAYEEHLKHCPVCERKAEWLASLGRLPVALFGRPYPALRAAAVVAIAFIVLVVPRGGPTSRWDTGEPFGSTTTRPKGVGNAELTARLLVDPDKSHLDEAISFWQRELSNDSESLIALAALAYLYQRKADLAITDEAKGRWMGKSRQASRRLSELLASPHSGTRESQ